jgi:hypothetical protein
MKGKLKPQIIKAFMMILFCDPLKWSFGFRYTQVSSTNSIFIHLRLYEIFLPVHGVSKMYLPAENFRSQKLMKKFTNAEKKRRNILYTMGKTREDNGSLRLPMLLALRSPLCLLCTIKYTWVFYLVEYVSQFEPDIFVINDVYLKVYCYFCWSCFCNQNPTILLLPGTRLNISSYWSISGPMFI